MSVSTTKISSMPYRKLANDLWDARLESGNPLIPLTIGETQFAIVSVSLVIVGQEVMPDAYETDWQLYYPNSLCWRVTYLPLDDWQSDDVPSYANLGILTLPHASKIPSLLLAYVHAQ